MLLICFGLEGSEMDGDCSLATILLVNKLDKRATNSVVGLDAERKWRGTMLSLVNWGLKEMERLGLAPVSSRAEMAATELIRWWRGVEVNEGLPVTTTTPLFFPKLSSDVEASPSSSLSYNIATLNERIRMLF